MKYQIEMSTRFKKDYKLAQKRGYNMNLLKEVIDINRNKYLCLKLLLDIKYAIGYPNNNDRIVAMPANNSDLPKAFKNTRLNKDCRLTAEKR